MSRVLCLSRVVRASRVLRASRVVCVSVSRVMCVSFHLHKPDTFFPGTGALEDVGEYEVGQQGRWHIACVLWRQ